jgi:hypothetical protein
MLDSSMHQPAAQCTSRQSQGPYVLVPGLHSTFSHRVLLSVHWHHNALLSPAAGSCGASRSVAQVTAMSSIAC